MDLPNPSPEPVAELTRERDAGRAAFPRAVVSQQFPDRGPWIVHAPGSDRTPNLAYLPTREKARAVASRINTWIRQLSSDPESP